eukprot:747591-Hanusia_phi.AAC.6
MRINALSPRRKDAALLIVVCLSTPALLVSACLRPVPLILPESDVVGDVCMVDASTALKGCKDVEQLMERSGEEGGGWG